MTTRCRWMFPALLALLMTFSLAQPALAEAPDDGSCERFGCLFAHDPQFYGRPGSPQREVQMGIADEFLPDGPGGRRFVQVLYPMVTATYRVQPSRLAAWDRVIQCESGGSWTAKNPRSSASGAFQILNGTWLAYGGGQFASQARWAHPMEQLTVAERIRWAGYGNHGPQGARAWLCPGAPGRP